MKIDIEDRTVIAFCIMILILLYVSSVEVRLSNLSEQPQTVETAEIVTLDKIYFRTNDGRTYIAIISLRGVKKNSIEELELRHLVRVNGIKSNNPQDKVIGMQLVKAGYNIVNVEIFGRNIIER